MKLLFAKLYLKLTGWKISGKKPDEKKYVLIAAPHTTNWDLPFMLAIGVVYDVKIKFMGKHTLFTFPLGCIMRRLGGIPIRRHLRQNVVEQSAALFHDNEELILTVPAEGTRGKVDYWKSGFYAIAKAADVPIVPGFLDYEKKEGGFGLPIWPTSDVRADMDKIRAFYEGKKGKYHENYCPPRLKIEESTDQSP